MPKIFIFYGPVIGDVISKLMRNAVNRIYIMSQTIGGLPYVDICGQTYTDIT